MKLSTLNSKAIGTTNVYILRKIAATSSHISPLVRTWQQSTMAAQQLHPQRTLLLYEKDRSAKRRYRRIIQNQASDYCVCLKLKNITLSNCLSPSCSSLQQLFRKLKAKKNILQTTEQLI